MAVTLEAKTRLAVEGSHRLGFRKTWVWAGGEKFVTGLSFTRNHEELSSPF